MCAYSFMVLGDIHICMNFYYLLFRHLFRVKIIKLKNWKAFDSYLIKISQGLSGLLNKFIGLWILRSHIKITWVWNMCFWCGQSKEKLTGVWAFLFSFWQNEWVPWCWAQSPGLWIGSIWCCKQCCLCKLLSTWWDPFNLFLLSLSIKESYWWVITYI